MTRIGLATLAVLLVTPLPAWSASVAIFEPPGARATQVADINNAGQVVGFVFDQPTSNGHNFIRQADGSFITIANLNTATIGAISDAGQIVGRLNSQSFIGSPTSAPGVKLQVLMSTGKSLGTWRLALPALPYLISDSRMERSR